MEKVWVIFKITFDSEEEFVDVCADEVSAKARIKAIQKSYRPFGAPEMYAEEYGVYTKNVKTGA